MAHDSCVARAVRCHAAPGGGHAARAEPAIVCRASKTALNQLTKTLSLEFKRRRRRVACVLLHPGTCDTDISAPFKKNVPPEQLFSAERGARQLLGIIDGVSMRDNGAYLAWDSKPIKW